MGLFSLFGRKSVEKASAGVPSSGMMPPLGSIPTASGMLVSQATAMTVSTVYRCVKIRSQDVARCRPRLVSSVDGVDVEITDHPIARLLRRPNRIQTWFEFSEQMTAARLLRGNAYAAILRDNRGNPVELIAINPDAVQVLESVDGQIFYSTNRIGLFQIEVLRSFPVAIPAEDMLHFRDLSANMLLGISTIGLARDEIGLAQAQTQQASRFVGNGARPSGVLKSPKQLTPEAAKRLKESWNSFVSGIQNTGSTAVLEDGLDWQALSLTSVDLQFIEQRKTQVYEVARFLGVPPHKLGIQDALKGIDFAKIDQQYVNEVIAPDLDRMEQRMDIDLGLIEEGLRIDFDESPLLRADVMTRYNAHRIGILTGILTPNEVRRSEGLAPVHGGDRLLVPANTAALGSDMTGTSPDGAGRPESGTLPDQSAPTSGDQPGTEPVKQ